MRELTELRKFFQNQSELELKSFLPVMEALSLRNPRYRASFVTFLAKGDPLKIFQGRHTSGFAADVQKFGDFSLVRLRREVVRGDIEGGRREVKGEFVAFKSRQSSIWIAFTSDGPDFFHLGLVRYLESFRPRISRVFISSEEMRGLLEGFSEELHCDVIAQKAVLYSHREQGQVTFEKEPYPVLFNFADNADKYVDKVEFKLIEKRRLLLHAFISRGGTAYYYGGKAGLFFSRLLPMLATVGSRKGKFFSNRQRLLGEPVLKPIEIAYPREVFSTPADNHRCIAALSNLERGVVTVYHSNPYLHLSLIDFVDGSNFDIFTGENDKLTIVPNYKCTVYSLMRIYEQLNRDFHEGELRDSPERSYQLSDFVEA